MEQTQRERNMAALEWFDSVVFALAAVLLILLFLFRTVQVDGTSMIPTLQNGDQLIALSAFYEPAREDIVVVDGYIDFGAPIVKRVIGVEGDVIDIDFATGDVFVNGKRLDEPYISAPTTRKFDVDFPVTVPEGHLFLMGDNRPGSKDSRDSEIGMIDKRDVLGKAILRLAPLNKFGGIQ